MALQEVGLTMRCLTSLLQTSMKISPLKSRTFSASCNSFGKMKFIKMGVDLNKYRMRPLPLPKSGGRGANGRIQTHGIGGGAKHKYRMVDLKRIGPKEGKPLKEEVIKVQYDPCRTGNIAVVAGGTNKRYILASHNMKVGDIISTSGVLTRLPVQACEGDAHPIGSLSIGTIVHNVEIYEGEGGVIARAAGTSAQLVRKVGDRCIVQIPSKREIEISSECMVTVGRVSNIDHNKKIIGSASRARWLGIRPSSGWKQKKTGYHGRKIKPIKPLKVYKEPPKSSGVVYRFSA